MKMQDILNSKLLKVFIKGSLAVIGISFVLFLCVVTLLLLRFGDKLDWKIFILIIILTIPLLVFLLIILKFICLVRALFNSLGSTNKEPLIKILKVNTTITTCIKIINAIKIDSGKDAETLQKSFKEILDLLSEISSNDEMNSLENKILYNNSDKKMLPAKLESDSSNTYVDSK